MEKKHFCASRHLFLAAAAAAVKGDGLKTVKKTSTLNVPRRSHFISTDMSILQGPDEEMMKRIQVELKEDPDRFENNLRLLEDWMECQPHLPKNYDKRMLPIYLRGCKHDMDKTKKKLELYFIIKSALPELFTNRDPERKDILEIVKYAHLAIIPTLTPQGYRVTCSTVNSGELSNLNVEILMARGSYSTCLRTVMETPIAGDIVIFDLKNLTASHAAAFITPLTRKCIVQGPEAYPNRIRQIHIVNALPLVEKTVSIFKAMLKEKLRNRFWVHVKFDGLKDFVPTDCLPNEYGGTAGKIEDLSRKTHEWTVKNHEWIKQQEEAKLIGDLPEKYKYKEEYGNGVEGSFRKLAID